ncbi:ABC transporter permease [Luteimicrobium subarcticum]|uniref:Peptide/nickel transport system permease protein n=1 Tax=Luteimicrobium subarcticum TaxID=620910 RepID=A0A2M8WSD7_9MICO|nr:ABC transporter permease [Luteimicrobium subarcticum]PJI93833.1 peptide/nickel transport system permease protein [Luteimicrobium subarcticum]
MKYYGRRVAFYAITLWAAISLNFFIPRMLPGDPADILLAKLARNGDVSPAVVQNVKLILGGSDESLWTQYWTYIKNLFHGDLGISVSKFPEPVWDLIRDALPWTICLVGIATILSFAIGIAGGAWIGWKRGTAWDAFIPFTTLLQSIPYFWLALLLVYFVGMQMGWAPVAWGWDVQTYDHPELSWPSIVDVFQHAVLPATTIILSSVGGWLVGMRNMMVSTLSEDYIVTAEAKGLRPRRVLWTYAVRNAALPSFAGFGVTLAFVVSGSLVMEQVFSYPGVGKLMITAVQNADYTLMQGVFLLTTVTVLAANFVMDIIYGFIDPRTRHHG